jgi:hypothetical protein
MVEEIKFDGAHRGIVAKRCSLIFRPRTKIASYATRLADAEARLVELDEEYRVPRDVVSEGLRYFLETTVAREVLDGLRNRRITTTEDACNLLLYLRRKRRLPRGPTSDIGKKS